MVPAGCREGQGSSFNFGSSVVVCIHMQYTTHRLYFMKRNNENESPACCACVPCVSCVWCVLCVRAMRHCVLRTITQHQLYVCCEVSLLVLYSIVSSILHHRSSPFIIHPPSPIIPHPIIHHPSSIIHHPSIQD